MIGSIADLLLIVLGFGVLIFVHELGHFVAAKWAGIRAEAFAIGMGPVALAWRKGIGLRVGSTVPEYTGRAHRKLVELRTEPKGRNEKGESAYTEAQVLEGADQLGLGETEYSLRYLPIGGFVKMLGQEDLNPNKTSESPRSYNSCPIGKRMIVVSAGVVMNIIFAAVLYIIAFSIGVSFEAPVLGSVSPTMPAANAEAINADDLGVDEPGIHPGDRVLSIDDDLVHTFADVQIATAMARPDEPLHFVVRRPNIEQPLHFEITPKKDNTTGLLGIGVAPASSTTLRDDMEKVELTTVFEQSPLPAAGLSPGMTLLRAADTPISTFEQFEDIVNQLDGEPVPTTWARLDDNGQPSGPPISAPLPVRPQLPQLLKAERDPDSARDYEFGLFGLVPLAQIDWLDPESPNIGIVEPGDVILRIDSVHAPQIGMCQQIIRSHDSRTIDLTVLRKGEPVDVTATISANGQLGVSLDAALNTMITATPIELISAPADDGDTRTAVETPIAPFNILPGTGVTHVGSQSIESWRELRETAVAQTRVAHATGEGASLELTIVNPTPGSETETVTLELTAGQVAALHDLGWVSTVSPALFEPLMTTRVADNPLHAIVIGVDETHKTMMLTYLTIDRLIRGSVGVEQLRGPVGIVHIGSKIADRGFIYLLYFLAIISVNLAVINFLPLPIVDGGLFLFLVYEKLKGRPPSPAFQHWATVAGLFMIGTAFLVVTWNDVMRLIP